MKATILHYIHNERNNLVTDLRWLLPDNKVGTSIVVWKCEVESVMLSKLEFLACLFLCLICSGNTEDDSLPIWPKPSSTNWNSSSCTDSYSLRNLDIQSLDPALSQDIQTYIANAVVLSKKSWGCNDNNILTAPVLPSLSISLTGATSMSPTELLPIAETLAEDYTIQITQDKGISIKASTILGVHWALASVASLASGTCSISCLPLNITDAPRFKHRGILVDSSRNFQPLTNLRLLIDAMSATKMNVLHWHISDSQSFPLEVNFSPNITQTYDEEMVYTQQQAREFVDYAWSRGIRVMPEFDMPGHTAIVGKSYPDLTACVDRTPWDKMCNQPPCGQLVPNKNALVALVSSLITEMADLFPSKMFSTGCDEVNFKCWEEIGVGRPQLLDFQAAVANTVVNDVNRTFVVWEESYTKYNLSQTAALPKGSVLLSWATPQAIPNITETGLYDILFAPYNAWYLDCGLGTPQSGPKSWCANNGGINTWKIAYQADPMMYGGVEEKVIGGEAAMWSEHVLPSIFDYVIWPRAAAVAERLWSSRNITTDISDAEERLGRFSNGVLKAGLGLNPSPLDWNGQNFKFTILPQWCNNATAFDSKGVDYCAPAREYCCGKIQSLSFDALVDNTSGDNNGASSGAGSVSAILEWCRTFFTS